MFAKPCHNLHCWEESALPPLFSVGPFLLGHGQNCNQSMYSFTVFQLFFFIFLLLWEVKSWSCPLVRDFHLPWIKYSSPVQIFPRKCSISSKFRLKYHRYMPLSPYIMCVYYYSDRIALSVLNLRPSGQHEWSKHKYSVLS